MSQLEMTTEVDSRVKNANKKPPIQRDWWLKSFAGVIGGFLLALGLSGLFAWWGPGGIDVPNKSQFAMWLIAPLWLLVMSLVYLFQTGWRAVIWLTAMNLVVFALLWLARSMGA